jgi:putative solute:sodium symporter small subunit
LRAAGGGETEHTMTTESEQNPSGSNHQEKMTAYWKKNVRLVAVLLAIWWVVSYGAGIIWEESLNSIVIPGTGFHLGFWFAQQGSIYVFVVMIFVYAWLMNKLDKEYDVHED